MHHKTLKSFTNLLQRNSELQNLATKVAYLAEINQLLASKLEPALASNCRVANLRDGILILATTSPAWNHKLRFYSADLLSELRRDRRWSGLKSIEIRVDYLPNTESASPVLDSSKITMSKDSSKLFLQLGQSVSSPALAQALKSLANKAGKTV